MCTGSEQVEKIISRTVSKVRKFVTTMTGYTA